jgi:hypothetical protein
MLEALKILFTSVALSLWSAVLKAEITLNEVHERLSGTEPMNYLGRVSFTRSLASFRRFLESSASPTHRLA